MSMLVQARLAALEQGVIVCAMTSLMRPAACCASCEHARLADRPKKLACYRNLSPRKP